MSFNFGGPNNNPQISGAKGMMNNGGGGNTGYMAFGKKKKKKREIEIDPKILEGEAEDKFQYQEDEYEDDDDYYGTASDSANSGDSFDEDFEESKEENSNIESSDVFVNPEKSNGDGDTDANKPQNPLAGMVFGIFNKVSAKKSDKNKKDIFSGEDSFKSSNAPFGGKDVLKPFNNKAKSPFDDDFFTSSDNK